jgi:exopolyphosphatase/guanosine-5'-triphosphate,3'-diphosphate pyrophosphatase
MKAAIDIGTNTVLLLIAEKQLGEKNNTTLKVIHEEQRIPRLGKGVDASGVLHPDSAQRVIEVLKEYKSLIEAEYPEVDEIIVTATSAVRDARNRKSFLNWVHQETGLEVSVLSGEQEADLTYKGALSGLAEGDHEQDVMVLDIGGGSTELILGRKGSIVQAHSFDMGCVRFTERFLEHDPPFREEILLCEEEINILLDGHRFKPRKHVMAIGVAGTLTSLAAIDKQVDQYDAEKINGHVVELEKLKKGIEVFSLHTHEQLQQLHPEVLKGRADIFLAGLLILRQFMLYYELSEITVSTGGVRHGALIR